MIQGAGMGYAFGRMGAFRGKEVMETYERFLGSQASHKLGLKQAKTYATFVALFAAFEGLPRAIRGVDDKWNSVSGPSFSLPTTGFLTFILPVHLLL